MTTLNGDQRWSLTILPIESAVGAHSSSPLTLIDAAVGPYRWLALIGGIVGTHRRHRWQLVDGIVGNSLTASLALTDGIVGNSSTASLATRLMASLALTDGIVGNSSTASLATR